MVNLNKSFLYGICFASLTWVISLYLYFQITKTEISSKKPLETSDWARKQTTSNGLLHKPTKDLKKNLQRNENYPNFLQKLKPIQNKNDKIDDGNYLIDFTGFKNELYFCNILYFT